MAKPPKDPTGEAKGGLRLVPPAAPKKARASRGTGKPSPILPAHVATAKDRVLVQMGIAIGYTHEQIARLIGVSRPTLTKYYAAEIERGGDEINLAIASNLASIAKDRNHKSSVTAAIYWTKARMGWTDQPAVEDPGATNDEEFTINIGGAKGA